MNILQTEDTICAIATAQGGAIGTIRVSGPEAITLTDRIFKPVSGKPLAERAPYTLTFGHILTPEGEIIDEVLVSLFRAPHSYTGQDSTEISCHGSSYILQQVMQLLIRQGCRAAGPGEYTQRAFLNGKLGLTQAEAVMDLISADGRQGAALANAALGGALAKKISAQKEALTAIQAHLAAWVDFPEEDVPELDGDHLHRVLSGVKAELDELIHNYQADTVLREGVDCAIVGRPNAGKSTLLNLLAGFDRAIVTPVAGTTRDVVEQAVQLGDIRLNLFDTAGLRETEDAIEAEGIRRSWKKLEEAGLIERKREGKNKPDKIYVKVPEESSKSENGGEQSFTSEGNDASPVRGTIVHLLNIEEKKRKKVIKKAGDPPDGNAITPDFEDVSEYFLDAGCENRLASRFMNYYEGTGWMTKNGKPITNWKAFADMWIDREQEKQQYSEPEFNRL